MYKEFVENTRRTWNKKEDTMDNINHALLGLIDESGELAKAYKSELAYGKELDEANIQEEIGDLCYFSARLIDELQFGEQDKLFKSIGDIVQNPLPKKVEVEGIEVVFAISTRVASIYLAMTTNDGTLIVKAVQDLMYALKTMCELLGVELESVMDSNTAKLKVRYPDKFDESKAVDRDLKAESEAIKDNVRSIN